MNSTPTNEFYSFLEETFAFFNKELFEDQLPDCLMTVQRSKKTMGYFANKKWVNKKGKVVHEISLNPAFFANRPLIEILQTLAHVQCHLWQFEYGKPSLKTYHNKQWSEKMESLGLIPSSTGQPGGKKTGQTMSEYPEPDGKFIKACEQIIDNQMIPWVDRKPAYELPNPALIKTGEPNAQAKELESTVESANLVMNSGTIQTTDALNTKIKNIFTGITEPIPTAVNNYKTKYTCFKCKYSLWGKPGINVRCNDCLTDLSQVEKN